MSEQHAPAEAAASLEIENRELRAKQLDLDASSRRYRELFEGAPVGYVVQDAGCIVEVNRAFADLVRADAGSLVGVPLASLVAPDDRRAFERYQRALLASPGGRGSIELRLSAGDGEPLSVRLDSTRGEDAVLRTSVIDIDSPLSVQVNGDPPSNEDEELAVPIVLVVEPNPRALSAYQELLWSEGFRMLAARTAADAVALFRRSGARIAAVLCDFKLPDTGGAALVAELRRLRQALPVVFVSGQQCDPELDVECAAPMTAHVTKPVEITRLATTLRRVLQRP